MNSHKDNKSNICEKERELRTVNHQMSGCTKLAQREYKRRCEYIQQDIHRQLIKLKGRIGEN